MANQCEDEREDEPAISQCRLGAKHHYDQIARLVVRTRSSVNESCLPKVVVKVKVELVEEDPYARPPQRDNSGVRNLAFGIFLQAYYATMAREVRWSVYIWSDYGKAIL